MVDLDMSVRPNMSKNDVCRVFIALVDQRSRGCWRTHKAIKAEKSKQWAKAGPQSSPKLQQKSCGAISLWGTLNRNVYQKPVCGCRPLRSLKCSEIADKNSLQPCPA